MTSLLSDELGCLRLLDYCFSCRYGFSITLCFDLLSPLPSRHILVSSLVAVFWKDVLYPNQPHFLFLIWFLILSYPVSF